MQITKRCCAEGEAEGGCAAWATLAAWDATVMDAADSVCLALLDRLLLGLGALDLAACRQALVAQHADLLDLGLLAGALAELEQLDIARTGHAVLVDGFFLFWHGDRKSTRLNSSHLVISYAVFCLKKKKENQSRRRR